jgi:hypothetical protein
MTAKTACHHPHRFCTSAFKVENNEGYLPRYTEASLPGEAEKHMGAPLQSELLTRKRPFVGVLCVILRQRAVYHESHLSIWTPRSEDLTGCFGLNDYQNKRGTVSIGSPERAGS